MRNVVESIDVMASVDEARNSWARFDDAWSAILWVLSRDPTVGMPLHEGGHVRAFVYDGSWAHEMPTVRVLYEITETQVIIHKIHISNPDTTAGTS